MFDPWRIYEGSDPVATRALFAELQARGLMGVFAVNLFRAQKSSARAKRYRGGPGSGQPSYRKMAYERKAWSIGNLVELLEKHDLKLSVVWGWRLDPNVQFGDRPSYVLYINLPCDGQPQVSFHSPDRGNGPDYPGDWDGGHASAERILKFCSLVLAAAPGIASQQRELHATP